MAFLGRDERKFAEMVRDPDQEQGEIIVNIVNIVKCVLVPSRSPVISSCRWSWQVLAVVADKIRQVVGSWQYLPTRTNVFFLFSFFFFFSF